MILERYRMDDMSTAEKEINMISLAKTMKRNDANMIAANQN